jgi:hypothetical protein
MYLSDAASSNYIEKEVTSKTYNEKIYFVRLLKNNFQFE